MERFLSFILSFILFFFFSYLFYFHLHGEVLCNWLCHLSWVESVCGKVLSFIFIFYHSSSSLLSCYLLSFYLLSVWRGFMQWVVSLELPGVCVWKDFIFLSFIFLSFIFLLFIFYLHGEVLCNWLCHLSWVES